MTEHHDHHSHSQSQSHSHSDSSDVSGVLAEMLDHNADVLSPLLAEVITWIDALTAGQPVRHILDVGTGTGTGAITLAQHFDQAEVIAADASPDMLGHLETKIRDHPVGPRIHPVHADLDNDWPDYTNLDLIWASASLHHMKDPHHVLTRALAALRPGGHLVVLEMDAFPTFLPDDIGLGTPGLEARCHAALADLHAAELPNLGADWGPYLAQAGYTTPTERTFTITLTPPLPAATAPYAQALLRRIRSTLDTRLSQEDLTTLDTLLADEGPHSLLHRKDLTVHATRTAWSATKSTHVA